MSVGNGVGNFCFRRSVPLGDESEMCFVSRMVPAPGLEPGCFPAGDFKSVGLVGISMTSPESFHGHMPNKTGEWETPMAADGKLPTILYRYYDDDGVLLYVGISNDFERRDRQHIFDKWRFEVLFCHQERWPNGYEAVEAERTAILAGKPKYNVRMWPKGYPVKSKPEDLGWFLVVNCDEKGRYLPPEPYETPWWAENGPPDNPEEVELPE